MTLGYREDLDLHEPLLLVDVVCGAGAECSDRTLFEEDLAHTPNHGCSLLQVGYSSLCMQRVGVQAGHDHVLKLTCYAMPSVRIPGAPLTPAGLS